ncbi:LIM domain transcription factor LMO4.2-like isoform X2 [Leptotrombidium deliense]|uniref:LIM domain transcription factor LMO4.2-like isoform X2 n=1 Tax=Leptotrombidium deliense TaxID=299467 RepID=A0A443SBC2_9ACAR|nr:LIM domain transcription factor LMO4.2-like isoform X2 [Leptotrombidium deliense]
MSEIVKNVRKSCVELKHVVSVCHRCGRYINERYMLFTRATRSSADDKYWHCNGCLRCDDCGLDFGESNNYQERLYFKDGKYLCKKDYHRFCGVQKSNVLRTSGYCSGCKNFVPYDSVVVKLNATLIFHVECLLCSKCKQRLSTGDKYVLRSDGEGVVCLLNCGGDARGRKRAVLHKK